MARDEAATRIELIDPALHAPYWNESLIRREKPRAESISTMAVLFDGAAEWTTSSASRCWPVLDQAWNRQRRVESLIDVEDVALGHETRMGRNTADAWVWSAELVHEPLVAPQEFEKAQERLREMAGRSADRKPRATPWVYVLRRLIFCGVCNRRMQGTWNNRKPHYRCRNPAEYAESTNRHPKSVYVREGGRHPRRGPMARHAVRRWTRRVEIDAMAGSLKSTRHDEASVVARRAIARCDARLASYRAALDSGADPPTVAKWIADVTRERESAVQAMTDARSADRAPVVSRAEIAAVVTRMGKAVAAVAHADHADKQALYEQLVLRLTYYTEDRTVIVEAGPGRHVRKMACRRGDFNPKYIRSLERDLLGCVGQVRSLSACPCTINGGRQGVSQRARRAGQRARY